MIKFSTYSMNRAHLLVCSNMSWKKRWFNNVQNMTEILTPSHVWRFKHVKHVITKASTS